MTTEPRPVAHALRMEFLARINRLAPVYPLYEAMLEAMYRRVITPGQCVYDIGCHAGRHARPMLELVGPTGRVEGFEPIPAMASGLRDLAQQQSNFTVHEVALGNRSGKTEFAFASGTPEESGLIPRRYNHPEKARVQQIEVRVARLDDLARELSLPDPDYIKIDVEGGELDALAGAEQVLSRARPLISVEYGAPGYAPYGHKARDLWDFAQAQGFVPFDLFGYRLPTLKAWLVECDRGIWDWFLVPSERADAIEATWR